MSAGSRGSGMSNYRGLRVTLTFNPEHEGPAFVSVAVKQARGGWDNWTALVPTLRVEGKCQWDLQEALDAVLAAIDRCEDLAWSSIE